MFLRGAKFREPFTVSQQVLAPFPRSACFTYLPMAMTLRGVVALALVAFAVTEDISQDAAPALEALPQSFWDNFVYCKCGLSCAENHGSIGKACHAVVKMGVLGSSGASSKTSRFYFPVMALDLRGPANLPKRMATIVNFHRGLGLRVAF